MDEPAAETAQRVAADRVPAVAAAVKEGFLLKDSPDILNILSLAWQRRYFVLDGQVLDPPGVAGRSAPLLHYYDVTEDGADAPPRGVDLLQTVSSMLSGQPQPPASPRSAAPPAFVSEAVMAVASAIARGDADMAEVRLRRPGDLAAASIAATSAIEVVEAAGRLGSGWLVQMKGRACDCRRRCRRCGRALPQWCTTAALVRAPRSHHAPSAPGGCVRRDRDGGRELGVQPEPDNLRDRSPGRWPATVPAPGRRASVRERSSIFAVWSLPCSAYIKQVAVFIGRRWGGSPRSGRLLSTRRVGLSTWRSGCQVSGWRSPMPILPFSCTPLPTQQAFQQGLREGVSIF